MPQPKTKKDVHMELQATNARTSARPDKNLPVPDKSPCGVLDKSPPMLPVLDKSTSTVHPGINGQNIYCAFL